MRLTNFFQSSKKTKMAILILGIASTVWFLIRVLPKPSRAAYPCMRAAAPFMSGLFIYLITLAGSVMAFRKAFEKMRRMKFMAASLFLILAVSLTVLFFAKDIRTAFASTKLATEDEPNTPMGTAKGIFPGRVVWVYDKNSTNENCTNKSGDYWFMDKNTSQTVVDTMLANGLKGISGQTTVPSAWDAVFKYFNNNHGKGEVGYASGEKIVIKVNLTTMGNGGRSFNSAMDVTPQLVFALLKQLIDDLGINQSDITIGDPYRGMPNDIYNLCHDKFPNVHYIEGLGTDGREQTEISADDVFFTSDGNFQSRLPQAYIDAAYLINMPCLKTHDAAGITIAAKNHQGSVIGPDQTATGQYMGNYLHYDYPVGGGAENQQMGIYRHIVDYMAHKYLGGNTLIYIVDAIWSGRNWDAVVDRWQMAPFNNDWTSSLFLSQDPVAIESVGFDFLYYEYKNFPTSHGNANFPLVAGVQDYIHQAADPANWPAGIEYDPSSADHSSPVGSLGVHEHWNNATDKQYTRNLGTNTGIELYNIVTNTSVKVKESSLTKGVTIFPNPAKTVATVKYTLALGADVHVELYSMDGKLVANTNNIKQSAGERSMTLNINNFGLSGGSYICKVITNNNFANAATSRLVIQK